MKNKNKNDFNFKTLLNKKLEIEIVDKKCN